MILFCSELHHKFENTQAHTNGVPHRRSRMPQENPVEHKLLPNL